MKGLFIQKQTRMRKSISKLLTFLLLMSAVTAFSQTRTVTGTVTEASGEPLIGVNVSVKGTTTGDITDVNGRYNIQQVPASAVLVFSYIGFTTQEIPLGNQSVINVVLKEELSLLDELVVIGYGTRQRRSISGAIDQLGAQVFEDRPVGNTLQALQGASANLTIQQRNMNPTDNAMVVNIRGVTSINNSDPLLVIDGMIATGLDALSLNLNPNDIENISILKDASAAIYGSRSANGVILITTKQGAKNTAPRIRFSGSLGSEVPEILYRPVPGYRNAELHNLATIANKQPLAFTDAQIADLKAHQSEEKWFMDQVYKSALQQSYNLSITGGSSNTSFLISTGYYDQKSNFVGNDKYGRQRYNFRMNLNTEWGRFKVFSTLAYNRTMDYTPRPDVGGVNTNTMRVPMYYYLKLKTDDGSKYLVNNVVSDGNSLALLEKGGFIEENRDNVIGNMNIEYSIFEGLKAKVLAGIDLTQRDRFRRQIQVPVYWENNLNTPARYLDSNRDTDDYNDKNYTLNTQFLLDFNRTFASVHHVNALLGVSNESYTRKQSSVGWRYTDEDLGLNSSAQATQTGRTGDNYARNQGSVFRSISSIFGRAMYDYDNKYYVEFTLRYDGSSRFAKDVRWGLFPSFSAAYRISEEDFMRTYKEKIGNLKIRTAYGTLGIQSVGDYAYQTTYSQQTDRYGFNNVSVPGVNFSYGNAMMSWESSANFNIGFDASFFKNSLDVTFDWFNKRTYGILMAPEIPSVFGTSSVGIQNLGEMQNRGWDLSIAYRGKTGKVMHRVSLTLGDSKNKVTDFGGKEHIRQAEEYFTLIREGEALRSYYGYVSAGLFQDEADIAKSPLHVGAIVYPGDVKYVDQNKDGVIDEKDRVILGNAFPRYTYGFSYDVAWKGFDLNILIQGVGKRHQMLRGEIVEPFHHEFWISTMYTHQMDFWTPDNPNAKNPRLATTGTSRQNNWQRVGTDRWLFDMGYLRVKNIRLGYAPPKKIYEKLGVQRARISVNVQNPFTFSKQSWVDPESTNTGSNMGGRDGVGAFYLRGNYPLLRYYGVSLDLEF